MIVKLAQLCDAANVTRENKLNITGIFDRIVVGSGFPVTWAKMVLVLVIEGHASEVREHDLEVRLGDDDGKELFKAAGKIKLSKPWTVGAPAVARFIMDIITAVFPRPGTYTFDILINGRFEGSVPLYVVDKAALESKK